METWVEDIVRALNNLGGQATLHQIYVEVERIRKAPLPKSWQANIRERIESHSSNSKYFRGNDLFQKVDRGTWALRDQAKIEQSHLAVSKIKQPATFQGYSSPESFEEISNILRTIKQYRDYQSPSSPEWSEYIREFFHILGFSTNELTQRLFTMSVMGSNHTPKAILGLINSDENFEMMVPGVPWESYLFFAAKYYQIDWIVLTNGFQLKVINIKDNKSQQPFFWSDLDNIVRNERLDTFCEIHKIISFIKGTPGGPASKKGTSSREDQDQSGKPMAKRHVLRLEFWRQLVEKAKGKTECIL
jgi:hypothetical protein